MRSTFYGLEIAKTGLFTAQNQLDVTGHNMSNSSTVGYTRQRLVTKAMPPGYGDTFIAVDRKSTAGRGVNTMFIEQVRNPFLDHQYRNENATTTQWTTKEQHFEYVEALFNNELDQMDVSAGLTSVIEGFYSSLYALVASPSNSPARNSVKENAIKITDSMHLYYNKLIEQQDALNESIRISVNEVNDLVDQIALLNKQISSFEITGARANDLRDQRNVLLDTLSGIMNITVSEDPNGQMVVQVGNKTLIHHDRTKHMVVEKDVPNAIPGEADVYGIYWADADGNSTGRAVEITNGALRGYLDIRDGDSSTNPGIPQVVEQLNAMARKLVEEFNAVHTTGWTLPGTVNQASRTGINFFDVAGLTAKTISLDAEILKDASNIACSDMPVLDPTKENNQTGNAEILKKLCDLIYKKDDDGRPDNLSGRYKELLNSISLSMSHMHTTSDAQSVMRAHLDQQRKSISAVSLDEEMTNIVRFGHSYSAASRMITAIDEELDTLINRMGLVGRS